MPIIDYQIDLIDLVAHRIQVCISVPQQLLTGVHTLELRLPAWIPGSYLVRDFAKHLSNVRAYDAAGEALTLYALDKQRWLLQLTSQQADLPTCALQLSATPQPWLRAVDLATDTAVQIIYELYCYDLSVRANYLNDVMGCINPAATCLELVGFTEHVHRLRFNNPNVQSQGSSPFTKAPVDWQMACALPECLEPAQVDVPAEALLAFSPRYARNYQHLIDSPVLLGKLQHHCFVVNKVPHHLVLAGARPQAMADICDDLAGICQQQAAVFQGLPDDLSSYWFLTLVTDQGYGGLEHDNSTLLLCTHADLPGKQQATSQQHHQRSDAYLGFLGLCSHEYFHAWWVKRLRPQALQPYQLSHEQYTDQLWLFEGFTSYYDDVALFRADIMTQSQYLTALSKTINRVLKAPSQRVQSVAESSFFAWNKFYKQDENAVNAVVSYYAKGAVIAWCMDALLSQHGIALDRWMQQLWLQRDKGTTFDSICHALTDVVTQRYPDGALAQRLCHRLHQMVYSCEPLPIAEAANIQQLQWQWRQAQDSNDLVGVVPEQTRRDILFGSQASADGFLQVKTVPHFSAAHEAGLMVGDLIIACDNTRVTPGSLAAQVQAAELGVYLELVILRQARLLQLAYPVRESPCQIGALLPLHDQENGSGVAEPHHAG
jgi:predicted metalloprotease with PDZ domain